MRRGCAGGFPVRNPRGRPQRRGAHPHPPPPCRIDDAAHRTTRQAGRRWPKSPWSQAHSAVHSAMSTSPSRLARCRLPLFRRRFPGVAFPAHLRGARRPARRRWPPRSTRPADHASDARGVAKPLARLAFPGRQLANRATQSATPGRLAWAGSHCAPRWGRALAAGGGVHGHRGRTVLGGAPARCTTRTARRVPRAGIAYRGERRGSGRPRAGARRAFPARYARPRQSAAERRRRRSARRRAVAPIAAWRRCWAARRGASRVPRAGTAYRAPGRGALSRRGARYAVARQTRYSARRATQARERPAAGGGADRGSAARWARRRRLGAARAGAVGARRRGGAPGRRGGAVCMRGAHA